MRNLLWAKVPIWAFLLAAWAILAGAVAESKWVSDIKSVAGKWEGTISSGGAGSSPYVLTINADGSWIGSGFNQIFKGTCVLLNGQLQFKTETAGRTGTMTLTETNGQKGLVMVTDDGTMTGELRPAK
jgi:hypothetical protein